MTFSLYEERVLCACFLTTVIAKLPLYPLHIWLPEAHVEAPTTGSVILASLLLKTGGFVIVRFMIPLFPNALIYFKPFLLVLCLLSTIYASINALRQIDIKKIIALSSIVHMGVCAMGLFIDDVALLVPAIYLMLGHGIVSAGLFFCVGCLYDRVQTRDLGTLSSLFLYMPNLSFYFLMFILGNIAFPGTVNFIAEFGIVKGLLDHNPMLAFFLMPGYIANAGFNIWLATRLLYGFPGHLQIIKSYEDIKPRESSILVMLLIAMFALGTFLANPLLIYITANLHITQSTFYLLSDYFSETKYIIGWGISNCLIGWNLLLPLFFEFAHMFATSISVLSEVLSALITLPPELSGDSITCSAKLIDSIIKHYILIDSNDNVLNLETWHLHWDETVALLKSLPEQNLNNYNFEQEAKKLASLMQPDSKKNYAYTLDQVNSAWRSWQDRTMSRVSHDFKLGVHDSLDPKDTYHKTLRQLIADKIFSRSDEEFRAYCDKLEMILQNLSRLYTEMESNLTAKNGGINPLSENAPRFHPRKQPPPIAIETYTDRRLLLLGVGAIGGAVVVWLAAGILFSTNADAIDRVLFCKWLKSLGLPHPWPWWK